MWQAVWLWMEFERLETYKVPQFLEKVAVLSLSKLVAIFILSQTQNTKLYLPLQMISTDCVWKVAIHSNQHNTALEELKSVKS